MNRVYIIIAWVWRVVILGIFGFCFGATVGDQEKDCNKAEEEPQRARENEGAIMVKRWVKRSMAELVGGLCEGVEGGVNVWCGVDSN